MTTYLKYSALVAIMFIGTAPARSQPTTAGPKVGDAAPPLGLEVLLQIPPDTKADWESLRDKVVVLEFWATWCGPCRAAIPHLNDLATEFENEPVRFVAVTNEKRDAVEPFLEKAKMRAWIGLDTDESVWKAYGIRAIPRTFIIDRQGRIAADTSPNLVTGQMLRNVLAGKPAGKNPFYYSAAEMAAMSAKKPAGSTRPLFQVWIRPATGEPGPGYSRDDELEMTGVPLAYLVKNAYAPPSEADAAYGIPDWPNDRVILPDDFPADRYDVYIRIPRYRGTDATQELRHVLEVTFGIRGRIESRDVPTYVLTKVDGEEPMLIASQCEDEERNTSLQYCNGSIEATSISLTQLAHHLRSCVEADVIDETGIEGRYDFDLKWPSYSHEAFAEALRLHYKLDAKLEQRPAKFLIVEYTQQSADE